MADSGQGGINRPRNNWVFCPGINTFNPPKPAPPPKQTDICTSRTSSARSTGSGGPGVSVAAALRHRKGGRHQSLTLLRPLARSPGPAYPEPCRRPTDGRFGDNPHRAQHYLQYQVLIKPSPDGIQETYLASLEALGIKAADHDIRFAEDTGAPTSALVELWLDGMEVTQFTISSNAAVSIASPFRFRWLYGLERSMYLQDVESIWDLSYYRASYGEIWLPFEKGQCHFNFEASNPDRLSSCSPSTRRKLLIDREAASAPALDLY